MGYHSRYCNMVASTKSPHLLLLTSTSLKKPKEPITSKHELFPRKLRLHACRTPAKHLVFPNRIVLERGNFRRCYIQFFKLEREKLEQFTAFPRCPNKEIQQKLFGPLSDVQLRSPYFQTENNQNYNYNQNYNQN